MEGIFITFEGPDGAGKTTQVALLEQYLNEKGYETIVTREPGGTPIGEEIRKLLLDVKHLDMSSATEMFLYAAARAQHVAQLIEPALRDGKIVLCDRFVDSSVAYQGFGRELGMDVVENINCYALNGVIPDLTLFFNLDPEEGLKRGLARSRITDRLENEKLEFHRRVFQGFCVLRDKYPCRVKEIHACQSVEKVFQQVLEAVKNLLQNKKQNII